MLQHTFITLLAGVLLMMAGLTEGFFLSPVSRPSTQTTMMMMMTKEGSIDRKAALQHGALLSSIFAIATVAAAPAPASAKDNKQASGPSFEESIATCLLSKKVLAPVRKYITIGQYDPARTNIKYVTNQFRIKKAMERAVLLAIEQGADEDKAFNAAEVRRRRRRKGRLRGG